MKDEATRASEAPLPETMEGLRRQNSAYRALCASLEAQMSILTEKGREYQEAVTTLDSEREANAILTAEVSRLTEEREALVSVIEDMLASCYGGLVPSGEGETRIVYPPSPRMLGIVRRALAKVKGYPDAR